MTPEESAQAAVDAVRTLFLRISRRSDVYYSRIERTQYDTKKWKGRLPEDFRLFYEALGGLHFRWGFTDDPFKHEHGPRFWALHPNGSKLIDQNHKLGVVGRMPASKHEYVGHALKDWGSDPVTIFSGNPGEGGLLLRQTGDDTFSFWSFDSDGDVYHLADSFQGFMEKGLASGFAVNWDRDHLPQFSVDHVMDRLKDEVPDRDLVEMEVVGREEKSGETHRADIAEGMTKGNFDKLMKALKRPERAKKLDDEERKAAALDAFEGSGKWPAAACKVAAPIVGAYRKSTRAAVRTALRYGEPDIVEVKVRVAKLDTKGAPKVDYPPGVVKDLLGDALGIGILQVETSGPYTFQKGGVAAVTCTFKDPALAEPLVEGWKHKVATLGV